MNEHICGFYHIPAPPPDGGLPRRRYLPQVRLDAHTTILSSLSRTRLTQTFTNDADAALPEVRYTFPLYDGVSVVGFVCRVDVRTIRGVVQEKQAARKTYEEATARGETAGLLEQLPSAADVFTTTVGNVPAGAELEVVIEYLGELKHDAQVDGVRFTLPTRIAPRYGVYPGELKTTTPTRPDPDQPGMRITVDVDLAASSSGARIASVQSPSHQTAVTLGRVSTTAPETEPSFQRASATLALGTAELDKDFVLQVAATQTGSPSAVLEMHPMLPKQRALMATLVPKFALPAEMPEVVFVCDRSGSMSDKVADLQAALRLFVKSLAPGSRFNICSFGTRHSFLWEHSMPYTRENAQAAMEHVESFSANYGGTEMHAPLKETFERRGDHENLEVFLLTDGEVWNHDALFAMVRGHVASSDGAIRLFTLGIGADASHALVEGLARVGNGFAQTVSKAEDMGSKIVRMLKGATFPHIKDYTLEIQYEDAEEEIQDDFEMVDKSDDDGLALATPASESTMEVSPPKASISLYDPTIDMDTSVPDDKWGVKNRFSHLPAIDPPKILQAPHRIPPLFPFNRTTVYLLLSPDGPQRTPRTVVLRGTSRHGPLELAIPIAALPEPGQTIHQLAAKKAVTELEEGGGWVHDGAAGGIAAEKDGPELAEREGIRLGERFQVAGKWASFVAVENDAARVEPPQPESAGLSTKKKKGLGIGGAFRHRRIDNSPASAVLKGDGSFGQLVSFHGAQSFTSRSSLSGPFDAVPMADSSEIQPTSVRASQRRSHMKSAEPSRKAMSMQQCSGSALNSSGPLFSSHARMASRLAVIEPPSSSFEERKADDAPPLTPAKRLHKIVQLQDFDGCWRWDAMLRQTMGWDDSLLAQHGAASAAAADVVATAAVVEWLRNERAADKDTWELIAEKAVGWLQGQGRDLLASLGLLQVVGLPA